MDDSVATTTSASPDHVIPLGAKPHSTPLTLKWLEQHYEVAEGVCIPRSTLYLHYRSFCQLTNTNPVNAASFGKIIRQQFPQISTRRLGTRGQSKYHYYGIGVRGGPCCVDMACSTRGLHLDAANNSQNQAVTGTSRSGLDMPLYKCPDDNIKLATDMQFPDIDAIKLPADIDTHKVSGFLAMYQSHCHQVLEAATRVDCQEVQSCVCYFWQGMSPLILPLLHKNIIIKLIGVCDSILYKALAGVLMPTAVHSLPDRSSHVPMNFAQELESVLARALWGLPTSLQTMKLELARRFAQVVRRQTSLGHLVQAARSVLTSPDILSQVLTDWVSLDLSGIVKQTLHTMDQYNDRQHSLILALCADFERLLDQQATTESYLRWLEDLVHCCVVKVSQKRGETLRSTARQFLLVWSCFGSRVVRDMTLQSAPGFASFHLLRLMFDDYVLYLMESLHGDQRLLEMMSALKGGVAEEDHTNDLILPDPAQVSGVFTSTGRSDQGHTRCQETGHGSTDGCSSRHSSVVGDNDVIDESSGDEEGEDGELNDDETQGQSCDVTSMVANASCLTSLTQLREHTLYPYTGREHTLYPYTSQQQQRQRVLQQQPPGYTQHSYSSQDVLTSHSSAGLIHPDISQPLSQQPTRPRDYMVARYFHNSQSSWRFPSHGPDATMPGTLLPIPGQHASVSQDDTYGSASLRSSLPGNNGMPQFHQQTGKSCQQNLTTINNVEYHGYMSVPQEVMSSCVHDNSSMKQKHAGSPEEDFGTKHSQLIKRPRHQSISALQHCGMGLL